MPSKAYLPRNWPCFFPKPGPFCLPNQFCWKNSERDVCEASSLCYRGNPTLPLKFLVGFRGRAKRGKSAAGGSRRFWPFSTKILSKIFVTIPRASGCKPRDDDRFLPKSSLFSSNPGLFSKNWACSLQILACSQTQIVSLFTA